MRGDSAAEESVELGIFSPKVCKEDVKESGNIASVRCRPSSVEVDRI